MRRTWLVPLGSFRESQRTRPTLTLKHYGVRERKAIKAGCFVGALSGNSSVSPDKVDFASFAAALCCRRDSSKPSQLQCAAQQR